MLGIGVKHELPTILVIDDDLVSREVMATVLTMSGFMVHTASDATDALGTLDSGTWKPEIILMDSQMPGLSGVELVEQIRLRSTGSLYAISASPISDQLTAVVDGYLAKPFEVKALQALLAKRAQPSTVFEIAANVPVVNPETLAQLRGMMSPAAVREIYTAMLADLDKRIAGLHTAIANRDTREIRRIGHSIKGGCGMAGALEVARLGAMLEVESNQLDNSQAVLKELTIAVSNLQRMLEAEFPG